MQRGIMSVLPPICEEVMENLSKKDELPAAAVAIADPTVVKIKDIIERVTVKRGEVLTFLDSEQGLAVVSGTVIAVQTLPVPDDYRLVLIRTPGRFYVAVHKADWLRMADNVRSVENEDFDTVDSYLKNKEVSHLSIRSEKFGGKSGFSSEFAANRLWKSISGKKLKAVELMI